MGVIDHTQINERYDYIVCGGGTSGPVVASRLAENKSLRVLLVEAGKDSRDMENVHMMGGWSKNFDTEADWNLVTEPSPGANGRTVKVSRGKFLGGSSGCNGSLCIRGTRQDYDDWNMPGWSGDDMWRCMSKAETFHGKEWFEDDKESHGFSGPLHTEPMDLAPISNLLLESMADQGLPLQHDMFSTGRISHGCGHAVRTSFKGLRTTGADFTRPDKENLDVLVDTLVDKILIDKKDDELFASAVSLIDSNEAKRTVLANKEIIVSCGTYCTPAVLMRSGIGDGAELADAGIDCKVHLPGVGKNLMDHLIVFIFYEASEAGLTTDHLLYHGNSIEESYRQWKEERRGALANFPFGAFAYARLDERMSDDPDWNSAPRTDGRDPMGLTPAQPNVEFFTTECYGGPKQFADFPIEQKHAFSMICELFSPRSKGHVAIKSPNPRDSPVISHNYLADPLDLAVLSEACTLGNEIVTKGKATKDILKGSWPETLTHHTYTHRDQWKPYVLENATTCYHPAGTAKMGPCSDQSAVVDEFLRVYGVKGLRVADCSVMPTLNQGHTQMPAYGIGEKVAEMILSGL